MVEDSSLPATLPPGQEHTPVKWARSEQYQQRESRQSPTRHKNRKYDPAVTIDNLPGFLELIRPNPQNSPKQGEVKELTQPPQQWTPQVKPLYNEVVGTYWLRAEDPQHVQPVQKEIPPAVTILQEALQAALPPPPPIEGPDPPTEHNYVQPEFSFRVHPSLSDKIRSAATPVQVSEPPPEAPVPTPMEIDEMISQMTSLTVGKDLPVLSTPPVAHQLIQLNVVASIEDKTCEQEAAEGLLSLQKIPKSDQVSEAYALTLGQAHFLLAVTVKGVRHKALFDTGSMASCLVTQDFARAHHLPIRPLDKHITIQFGNGYKTRFSKKTEFNLWVGGYKFPVEAMVLQQATHPIIIGDPWLKAHEAILNYQDNTFSCTTRLREKDRVKIPASIPTLRFSNIGSASPIVAPDQPTMFELQSAKQFSKGCIRDGSEEVIVWTATLEDYHMCAVSAEEAPTTPSQSPDSSFTARVQKAIPREDSVGLQLKEILKNYEDLFPIDLPDTPPPVRDGTVEVIKLHPNVEPTSRPLFRYSPAERAEMQKQVAHLLQKGLIEPSTSPFGAPVLFAPKKDGTWRMCIDYRALNKITIKNRYPLPRVDDLLDKLQGAKVFSSLDLLSGYHQLRLLPEECERTAFKTPEGLYQYKVVPFGLTNAPSVFMSQMNQTLKGLPNVVVYLDDVLIYSKDEVEHLQHLQSVLQRLKDRQFYVKLSKCDFFKEAVTFLGHTVTSQGIKPDPKKISVVQDWPTPATVHDVRAFLGMAQYFKRFLENLSKTAAPLSDLLKCSVSKAKSKTTPVHWTPQCTVAFEKLKQMLISAPCLALPDFTKPFTVITDASLVACGAILVQDGHPVAFESKKFSQAEQNYHTTDQELLAVIHALKAWRCYLEGVQFTIVTDHNPLTHLKTQPHLSRRQARWSEFLQEFSFDWIYKPGATNPADALTRLPEAVLAVITTPIEADTPALKEQCRVHYEEDPWFANPAHLEKLHHSEDGCYYKGTKLVVPRHPPLRKQILEMAHDDVLSGHMGINKTEKLINRHFWWKGLRKHICRYVKSCLQCQQNKALKQKPAGELHPLPVPGGKWWTVTMDFITGLPSTSDGLDAILVFTDKLTKMIHLVPCATDCTAEMAALLFIREIVRLHGLPRTLVSDRDPRFTGAMYQEIVRSLGIKHSFSTAYHPETDGQTERVNQCVEDYLRAFVLTDQTQWQRYLPMAEFAFNNSHHVSLDTTPFILNYGVEPRTPIDHWKEIQSTKVAEEAVTPAAEFMDKMRRAVAHAQTCLQRAQDRQAAAANQGRRVVTYAVDDQVMVHTKNMNIPGTRKLSPRWVGPFPVTRVINPVAVQLHLPNGYRCHNVFHVSLLKPYVQREGDPLPPPSVLVDGEPEWKIQAIVGHKGRKNRKGKKDVTHYLVRWEGYGPNYDSWEPLEVLADCTTFVDAYWNSRLSGARGREVTLSVLDVLSFGSPL